MRSVVTKRGQTVIPAPLRKKYGIEKGATLIWIDTGEGIKVVPICKNDVIKTLRGIAKGENLRQKLLEERKKDEI